MTVTVKEETVQQRGRRNQVRKVPNDENSVIQSL